MRPEVISPGPAPMSTPTAYLWWGVRLQWRSLLVGLCFGIIWMTSLALVPWALGRGIDAGIEGDDPTALIRWALVIVGLAALIGLSGAVRHWFAMENFLGAAYRTIATTDEAVTSRGQEITRRHPVGDVVSITTTDMEAIGQVYDVTARFGGAVVSYFVVAVLLLRQSLPVGLVVVLGSPILLGLLALVIKPLQRRQAAQREESGRLTTLGTDTVAGLRILRGIGGESEFVGRYAAQSQRVRRAGVRVAGYQAVMDAAQVFLPGLFVVVVLWAGARAVLSGSLSAGELVSFYGYATFLSFPLRTFTEMAEKLTRFRVAANKAIAIQRVDSDHAPGRACGAPLPEAADLHDPASGATFPGGQLTAIVSARPEDSAALADRLGRISADSAVELGLLPLADLPIAQVREHILVNDSDSRLFSGSLRDQLTMERQVDDQTLLGALDAAWARDVLRGLPEGLDGQVEEKGRSFSGGQRQRLGLARALAAQPPVLVLIEPTSAVDALTEAAIGGELAAYRRGRTTVVATASPLLLQHTDHVVLLADGRVSAQGRHPDLVRTNAAYRAIVLRGGGE